jgi:hypothetical protein
MMRRFWPNWRTRASVARRTLAVYVVSVLATLLLGTVRFVRADAAAGAGSQDDEQTRAQQLAAMAEQTIRSNQLRARMVPVTTAAVLLAVLVGSALIRRSFLRLERLLADWTTAVADEFARFVHGRQSLLERGEPHARRA